MNICNGVDAASAPGKADRFPGSSARSSEVRIYRRLWTDAEIAGQGDFVERLYQEPTLFHVPARDDGQAVHAGPLSLKTVLAGKCTYRIGNRAISIRPGQLLLMPAGQPYATQIGSEGAEIFTFYFPHALVSQALTPLPSAAEWDPDRPLHSDDVQSAFPPHVRRVDNCLAGMLQRLARSGVAPSEWTLDILGAPAVMIENAVVGIGRVPASRPSVRKELFRRVSIAREQIESELARDVPLAELARTACLSPFHLHRMFKHVYGLPPASLRRRLRIQLSRQLLARTAMPVRDVAMAVGFANEAAFSRAFRSACRTTPTAFRRGAGF